MELKPEQLEDLYRRATAAGVRRAGCPSSAELERAASDRTGRRERRRLAEHLAVCSDCAEEYRLMGAVQSWVVQEVIATGRQSPVRLARQWRWVAAAAAVLMAVGLSWMLWRRPVVDSAYRGVEPAIRVSPPSGAVLDRAPAELRWMAAESVESYQVVLYDFESTQIWESPRVREPVITLPRAVLDRLQPGRRYYWRVLYWRGIERQHSALFQFQIAP